MLLKDADDDNYDRLLWKWAKGAATTKMEFGDPVDTHGYELCVYSGGGLVSNSTLPASNLWSESPSGFKYSDPAGSADGIQKVLLKAGADQKAKILVKAREGDRPDRARCADSPNRSAPAAGGTSVGRDNSFQRSRTRRSSSKNKADENRRASNGAGLPPGPSASYDPPDAA